VEYLETKHILGVGWKARWRASDINDDIELPWPDANIAEFLRENNTNCD
jgi:hypothetical protein